MITITFILLGLAVFGIAMWGWGKEEFSVFVCFFIFVGIVLVFSSLLSAYEEGKGNPASANLLKIGHVYMVIGETQVGEKEYVLVLKNRGLVHAKPLCVKSDEKAPGELVYYDYKMGKILAASKE